MRRGAGGRAHASAASAAPEQGKVLRPNRFLDQHLARLSIVGVGEVLEVVPRGIAVRKVLHDLENHALVALRVGVDLRVVGDRPEVRHVDEPRRQRDAHRAAERLAWDHLRLGLGTVGHGA